MKPIYIYDAELSAEQLDLAMRPGGVVMMSDYRPQVEIIRPAAPLDFPLGWDERDAKI